MNTETTQGSPQPASGDGHQWFTVVFRGLTNDERRELVAHKKGTIFSYSNAIADRDDARAASGAPQEAPMTTPELKLWHVDDCMYVAAATREEAIAHVKAECGEDCGEDVHETSLDFKVTTADADEGEEATPDTMTTARALIAEHLKAGGTAPYTVCYDAGM